MNISNSIQNFIQEETSSKDANEFLQTGKYWKEVVDVIVQVSAAALKINVHIYQNNQGLIQVLSHKSASEGKDVYIEYRRFGTAGHYNAITKDTSIPIPLNIPCAQGRGEEREPNYEKEEEEEDEEYINILLARKNISRVLPPLKKAFVDHRNTKVYKWYKAL